MKDWSEIMGRRDQLAALLRPHLGKEPARERANDIIQALLCADERADEVALRMLARDLEQRAAEVVAFQVGRAWNAPKAPVVGPAQPQAPQVQELALPETEAARSSERARSLPFSKTFGSGVRFKRPRRETIVLSDVSSADVSALVRRISRMET